jgi:hypothetical protein
MSFWDIIWFIIVSFAFFAYLMVLFRILIDLFRDPETRGLVKAVWVIALIFVPFLTALIYLIARGDGMARRAANEYETARAAQDEYIKSVAGGGAPSAAQQIAHGKELLDSGAIDSAEFAALKAKALA